MQTASRKETTSFWDTYENLCALQNLMPLQSLKTCLSSEAGAVLSLNADKLKYNYINKQIIVHLINNFKF